MILGEQITAGVAIFIATALLGFIGGQFMAKRRAQSQRLTAIEVGVKSLLRVAMLSLYAEHIEAGRDISSEQFSAFTDMASAYDELKGKNGYMTAIVKKFKTTPLKGGDTNAVNTQI